jgi:hypothetical protein
MLETSPPVTTTAWHGSGIPHAIKSTPFLILKDTLPYDDTMTTRNYSTQYTYFPSDDALTNSFCSTGRPLSPLGNFLNLIVDRVGFFFETRNTLVTIGWNTFVCWRPYYNAVSRFQRPDCKRKVKLQSDRVGFVRSFAASVNDGRCPESVRLSDAWHQIASD